MSAVPASILPKPPQWKVALWARDSIEPAMLRVPIVFIVFVALWGINVWLMDRQRIPYNFVLNTRSVNITYIFATSGMLLISYALIMTLCTSGLGWSIETGIMCFYSLLIIYHLLPYSFITTLIIHPQHQQQQALGAPSSVGMEHYSSFFKLLKIVLFPVHSITFPEVLLADALCSISKVLKDWGTSMIAIVAYIRQENIVEYHNEAMILVAILASLPFWIRVRQCWVQLDSCPDIIARIPVTLNILKYLSSFPPIWLTAAASLGYLHPAVPAWITYAAIINSSYSYLWDVIMDWGMISILRDGRILRRQRWLYPSLILYLLAIVLNFALRFSWTINRLPGFMQMHSSIIVLVIEIGEVCRRAMWNFFRIEWEVIVQQEKNVTTKEMLEEKDLLLTK